MSRKPKMRPLTRKTAAGMIDCGTSISVISLTAGLLSDVLLSGGVKLGAVGRFTFTLISFAVIGLACITVVVLSINKRINNIQSRIGCCIRP
jgi:hypothetical protein